MQTNKHRSRSRPARQIGVWAGYRPGRDIMDQRALVPPEPGACKRSTDPEEQIAPWD
jgi:hypothetical protein